MRFKMTKEMVKEFWLYHYKKTKMTADFFFLFLLIYGIFRIVIGIIYDGAEAFDNGIKIVIGIIAYFIITNTIYIIYVKKHKKVIGNHVIDIYMKLDDNTWTYKPDYDKEIEIETTYLYDDIKYIRYIGIFLLFETTAGSKIVPMDRMSVDFKIKLREKTKEYNIKTNWPSNK